MASVYAWTLKIFKHVSDALWSDSRGWYPKVDLIFFVLIATMR